MYSEDEFEKTKEIYNLKKDSIKIKRIKSSKGKHPSNLQPKKKKRKK